MEIENHFLPECGRVFYFYFAGSYIFEIESPTHKHECVVHVAEYGKILPDNVIPFIVYEIPYLVYRVKQNLPFGKKFPHESFLLHA